jgi:hypothetical protein
MPARQTANWRRIVRPGLTEIEATPIIDWYQFPIDVQPMGWLESIEGCFHYRTQVANRRCAPHLTSVLWLARIRPGAMR